MASSCGTGAISGAMGMGDDVAASASSSVAGGCGQGAAPKTAAAGAVLSGVHPPRWFASVPGDVFGDLP